MRKRIIIAYANLDIGGIPTKIVDIVNEMGKYHPEISVFVLLQKGKAADLRSSIRNPNVRVVDLRYPFAFGRSVIYIFWLWWWILAQKPSAILAFISPYALPALLAKRIFFWRQIRVVVSEDHYTETMLDRMAAPLLQRLGIKLLYPLANTIITPTEAVKHQLIRLAPAAKKRVVVIPNWTKLSDMPIPKHNRVWDIIHIGRLAASKNPLRVVRIMERYLRMHPRARCAIVGEGPEKQIIKSYIHAHNLTRVELYPATSDVSAYLTRAKLFLFLPESKTEGFPLVLLEAMACGAIVVTTPFDGAEEVLKNNINCFISLTPNTIRGAFYLGLNEKIMSKISKQAKEYVIQYHSKRNAYGYLKMIY